VLAQDEPLLLNFALNPLVLGSRVSASFSIVETQKQLSVMGSKVPASSCPEMKTLLYFRALAKVVEPHAVAIYLGLPFGSE
jgi:hypothetical protein